MPNNHAEATTFVKYGPGEGGVSGDGYSYSSLTLTDLNSDLQQLEVLRVFDTTAVATLVTDPPDGPEKESLFILQNETTSGSPMYTLDTTNKKIVFNTDATNYIWKAGWMHNRGLDVQLPVINPVTDTVIIRRKTYVLSPEMVWTAGSKVTSRGLNAQTTQMLNLIQELRSYELNPITFDFTRGAPNGLCPLDANGVVPLKHISEQLGGQGILAVDLSDSVIEDLKDVDITETSLADGQVLTWDNAGQNWVNLEPLSKTLDLSTTQNQQVLKWTGSTWELARLNLDQINNVDITVGSLETSNIIYYNATTATWKPSSIVLHDGSLTNDHVLTWNYADERWEAKVRPDITYEVFNLSTTSIYTMADMDISSQATGVVEGDVIAWFNNDNHPNTWRDKSLDTWDLNNIWGGSASAGPGDAGYSNGLRGAMLHQYYEKGFTLFWDKDLAQKDSYGGVRGSFHAGPIFSGGRYDDGTPHCDFANANNNEVIKWKNQEDGEDEDKWILGPLNLNHLGDVHARYYDYSNWGVPGVPPASTPPNTGDILQWDPAINTAGGTIAAWRVQPGPGTTGTIGTHLDQISTTHRFDILIDSNNLNVGQNHAGVWMDTYYVNHRKLSFNRFELLANSTCRCRIRLYKATYSTFGNAAAWVQLTQTDADTLGWGQGQGTDPAYKKARNSQQWQLTDGIVNRGDILIFELENFYDTPSGAVTNILSLRMIWDILEF